MSCIWILMRGTRRIGRRQARYGRQSTRGGVCRRVWAGEATHWQTKRQATSDSGPTMRRIYFESASTLVWTTGSLPCRHYLYIRHSPRLHEVINHTASQRTFSHSMRASWKGTKGPQHPRLDRNSTTNSSSAPQHHQPIAPQQSNNVPAHRTNLHNEGRSLRHQHDHPMYVPTHPPPHLSTTTKRNLTAPQQTP